MADNSESVNTLDNQKSESEDKPKRKLNGYFAKMLEAKKQNLESFDYNNNTYVKSTTKNGMIVYKKQQ